MANALLLKPLAPLTVTADSSAAGHDPSYMLNDYAGLVWRSNPPFATAVTVDLGSAQPVDTVMMFGCLGALPNWLLYVVGADDAALTSNVVQFAAGVPFLAGSVTPVSGRAVSYHSGPVLTRRYWRIQITDAIGAPVDISIARLVMGVRVQLARNFSFGAGFGVKDLGSVDFSRRGVLLRTRGAKLRTLSLTFTHIRKDEAEATMSRLLEQLGNTEPLAVITDPAADAQRMNRCYFGPLVGDLSLKWRNAGAWEAGINLVHLF